MNIQNIGNKTASFRREMEKHLRKLDVPCYNHEPIKGPSVRKYGWEPGPNISIDVDQFIADSATPSDAAKFIADQLQKSIIDAVANKNANPSN